MRLVNRLYLVALLLPLLLLALVPSLRLPAQKLMSGYYRGVFALPLQFGVGSGDPREDTMRQPIDQIKAPDSLDAEIWGITHYQIPTRFKKLELRGRAVRDRSVQFPVFAQLARENPRNALILVCALNWMPRDKWRIAGPWEDPAGWDKTRWNLNGLTGSALPPPPASFRAEPPDAPFNADMILALQLARRGQKLEPNNSFFDWMAARALFSLRRDADATRVLVAASHKTGFDLHWRDFWAAAFHTLEKQGPLLVEEKMPVVASTWLSYLSGQNHVRRLALWNAMQKEDAGDVAGALEIEGALARLGMVWHARALFTVEMKAGAMVVRSAWHAPSEMRVFRRLGAGKTNLKLKSLALTQARGREFERYALDQGRADLARETARFEAQLVRAAIRQDAQTARETRIFSIREGDTLTALLSSASAVLAMRQFAIALLLWLFFTIWGPLLPPRGETPRGETPRGETPRGETPRGETPRGETPRGETPRGETPQGETPQGETPQGETPQGETPRGETPQGETPQGETPLRLSSRFLIYPLALGAGFSVLLAMLARFYLLRAWNSGDGSSFGSYADATAQKLMVALSVAAIASPFVLSAFFPLVGAMRLASRSGRHAAGREFSARELGVDGQLSAATGWVWNIRPWLWWLFLPAVACCFGSLWIFSRFEPGYAMSADNTQQISLVCTAAWLIFGLWRFRFGMPRAHRGAVYAGFFALRRALAWTIPLSLWLLLGAIASGIAPRARAERELERFLASENSAVLTTKSNRAP